jgi:hypothetical protein
MFFGCVAEVVEYSARLHTPQLSNRVHLEYMVHVSGKVHDHGDVAALAREAGAASAGKHRRAMTAACGHDGFHIFHRAGTGDANWGLPVIGGIGSVKSATAGIESYIAGDRAAKVGLQRRDCRFRQRCVPLPGIRTRRMYFLYQH